LLAPSTLSTSLRCICSCSCGRASSSPRSEMMMFFLPVSGSGIRRMVISGIWWISCEPMGPSAAARASLRHLAVLPRAFLLLGPRSRGQLAVGLLLVVAAGHLFLDGPHGGEQGLERLDLQGPFLDQLVAEQDQRRLVVLEDLPRPRPAGLDDLRYFLVDA